jgi:hypothetical protein
MSVIHAVRCSSSINSLITVRFHIASFLGIILLRYLNIRDKRLKDLSKTRSRENVESIADIEHLRSEMRS